MVAQAASRPSDLADDVEEQARKELETEQGQRLQLPADTQRLASEFGEQAVEKATITRIRALL